MLNSSLVIFKLESSAEAELAAGRSTWMGVTVYINSAKRWDPVELLLEGIESPTPLAELAHA